MHWAKNYLVFFAFVLIAIRTKNLYLYSFVLIALISFAWFKFSEWKYHLSVVPDALNVSTILYSNEESWGFGPGGNETGIIVYELPDGIAREIQKAGIEYFAKLPQKTENGRNWHLVYRKWQNTPMQLDLNWADPEIDGKTISTPPTQKIENYLNVYGFGIPIDSSIKDEINKAISEPGSYFAYGRIGVLIVVPNARRVIYAYNG
jgi:hypothetical protein